VLRLGSSLRIESLMINRKPFQCPYKYCELCPSIHTSVCLELGALLAYLVGNEVFASNLEVLKIDTARLVPSSRGSGLVRMLVPEKCEYGFKRKRGRFLVLHLLDARYATNPRELLACRYGLTLVSAPVAVGNSIDITILHT
jgi:hypothetical protein